jgi:uncharacterized protein YabE (DUF348 family)
LLRIGAVGLGLLGFSLLFNATGKLVFVVTPSETLEIRTHAHSVRDVLAEIGLASEGEYAVDPPLQSQIHHKQVLSIHPLNDVVILTEGRTIEHRSPSMVPSDWLSERNLRLFPGDSVYVEGVRVDPTAALERIPEVLELRRAFEIQLWENGKTHILRSSASTLGEALWEWNITLREGDRIDPGPETVLQGPLSVELHRAIQLSVELQGTRRTLWSAGPQVADAIADAGLSLQGLDYSLPEIHAPIEESLLIQIVRVSEEVLVEQEPLPFETIFQPNPNLEIDTQAVVQEGKYGVLARQFKIRYEDGVEVSRQVEDEWRAVEPEAQIMAYGTKIVVRSLATPDGTIEYWRAVPVYATSYMDCPGQDPGCGARTASGKEVEVGMIGVLRSWFNAMRGWPVYVPGYGPATIEDIGAGIQGRDWIDLAYPNEVYVPWAKWTTLYFLTPVPAPESILYILP